MEPQSPKLISITPDVFLSHTHHYLIRLDGEIIGYCHDEKTAVSIVNSIAAAEVKNNEKDRVKVFRRDLKNGVQICTQSLGNLWNGSVKKACVVVFEPVALAYFTENLESQ